jgi:hypothetical protein
MLQTKKKTLVACPVCESMGKKSILGELGDHGEFIVQRFHQGETIIKAPILAVVCGLCHGTAYIKNESVTNYQILSLTKI